MGHARLPIAILRYHRIADLPFDPHGLAVSPGAFRQQLEVVLTRYRVVALDRVLDPESHDRSPRAGVAITFDDGYADVVETALPLLERHGVPATVFVVTGYLDQRREFWWDRLELLCLAPDDQAAHAGWSLRARHDPTPGHRRLRDLFLQLKAVDEAERSRIIARLEADAGLGSGVRPSHRILSGPAVRELGRHPLVRIGAHTVSHPLLGRIAPGRRREEIEDSKAAIESLIGGPVTCFAYPYGAASRTASLVKRAGFEIAVTTGERVVMGPEDRYRLPRIRAGNWDGEEFARWLGALLPPRPVSG